MKQFWQLCSIHFKQIIREPAVLFWGFAFPLIMAGGLGIAFSSPTDTEQSFAVVGNFSGNSDLLHWQQQAQKVNDTTYIKQGIKAIQLKENQAIKYLKRGEILLYLLPDTPLRFVFDEANKDAKLLKYRILEQIKQPISYISQKTEIQGTRYIDFLLPGLIGMTIMNSMLWGISYGLIEKRKQLLLRRMYATPMRKSYFLSSLILVRALVNAIEMATLIIFAHFMFNFSLQGDWISLTIVFIVGHIAFAGISVALASRTSSTEVGNGIINLITLPLYVLSGIFFSYHYFPDTWEAIIRYLPLTLILDMLRAFFNEGRSILEFIPETLLLLTYGIIPFYIGLKIFKWF